MHRPVHPYSPENNLKQHQINYTIKKHAILQAVEQLQRGYTGISLVFTFDNFFTALVYRLLT